MSNPGRERADVDVTPGIGIGIPIPGAGIPAMSSISTSVFKNVKEWWDTQMKGEAKFQGANRTDDTMPWSTPQALFGPALDDAVTNPYESEEEMAKLTVLPSALTVKTFAQQTIDRTREQQRNHHEFVALLRENRQKARPLNTGKSYERVQRWWMVCAGALRRC